MGEGAVKYLIIGGGAAAAQAAVGIRELDAEGSVTIVAKESWWPYDRPPLSKGMLVGQAEPADAESKDPSWYEKNNVTVKRGVEAVSLDTAARQVDFSDDSTLKYDRLLIATGATPNNPPIPGIDLKGVHLFRTADDSLAVREALKSAKSAVMVGAGYIGMEVASGCVEQGVAVTIVEPTEYPWSRSVSPLTGNFIKSYFESKGAKFRMGELVAGFEGDGSVSSVVLKSGERIAADLVVVGVGVHLNVDLAKGAGLALDPKHGVVVNEQLRTQDPDVFVAGDVAAFQDVNLGYRWHAEHYLNARWQGKQAGRNMAGANENYDQIPYFFSDMLDIHMVLRGDPNGGKSVGAIGDVDAAEFVELYAREDGTLAMGLGFSKNEKLLDPIADKLEELYRQKAKVEGLTKQDFGLE